MNIYSVILFLEAALLALAAGQRETTELTGKVGESLCLITGLEGLSQVILSSGSNVLINFDNGELELCASQRCHLDKSSINISPLNRNDSGVYFLQITHSNNSVIKYALKINVTEADHIQPAGPSDDDTPGQEINLLLAMLTPVVAVAVILLLVFCLVKRKKSEAVVVYKAPVEI